MLHPSEIPTDGYKDALSLPIDFMSFCDGTVYRLQMKEGILLKRGKTKKKKSVDSFTNGLYYFFGGGGKLSKSSK